MAIGLGATSALLVGAAMRKKPENRDLECAAGVNVGWVMTCLIGLLHRPPPSGAVILASTAVLDGVAAIAQLALRSDADEDDGHIVEFRFNISRHGRSPDIHWLA